MKKILKLPFDAGNPTGKRGPSFAPEKLAPFFSNIPKKNIKIDQSNIKTSFLNITRVASREFKAGNYICSIGGDHSITYPLVKAASKTYNDLTLIYFDAHLDCEDYFSPPSHEDVIRAIVEDAVVKPEKILIVGARKYWPKEKKFVDKFGIKYISPKEMKNFDFSSISEGKIYISVDIDVFDSNIVSATNYPEKGGITPKQFQQFTQKLSFKRIIGFDLVEVSPYIGNGKKTLTVASDVIRFLLC